ncbi:MAG TPA: asparagine synthase (glutamine-hydrolyzing) [Polyangia bacterium]|nr:asparagine synthase (glutamine-hydrolyzing) [Polyangia bacterium]
MCGFAGFIARQADPAALPRMLREIAHRGPDGDGTWLGTAGTSDSWQIALGHRRLAIIDLAGGVQPMTNEDGRVVITYNGELYNFQALRAELEQQGHQFRTRNSDTETIVHFVEQHGTARMSALEGMFAFAVWDARAERLTLARDRCGIKPLYYAELADGGLAFGSELTAVLAHGGVDRALGADGLASYFFSDYVHPPYTIVGAVKKLPPGHTLIWERGRLQAPQPFWQVPEAKAAPRESDRALAERLWSEIERAVEAQLLADVPVGIFLSGGIDSSSVAAAAARRAGHRMKAFSIGFEDATFDESAYARMVADQLGVEHIVETLREENLLEVVDLALDKLDEPLADPSFLPTFLLSRLAARHVKVVIGGDGGDELWGGYPTYRAHRLAAVYGAIPGWIRRHVIEAAVARLPVDDRYQSLEWKLRRFTGRWDDARTVRHLRWMSSVDLPDLPRAVPAARGLRPATLGARVPAGDDRMNQILALDFSTYMSGSVLAKVDRASMAHGLEVRPPLLDDALVDLAFSLPSRVKLRGGQLKHLLKLAARGRIPDAVIDRPKKGFGIPLAAWLRGPLAARLDAVVAESPLWDLGLVDRATFAAWNDEHRGLQRDRSKPLWALYVLDRWLRRTGATGVRS